MYKGLTEESYHDEFGAGVVAFEDTSAYLRNTVLAKHRVIEEVHIQGGGLRDSRHAARTHMTHMSNTMFAHKVVEQITTRKGKRTCGGAKEKVNWRHVSELYKKEKP